MRARRERIAQLGGDEGAMAVGSGTMWPPIESAYTDEFGHIEPEVYRIAGELWAQAARFAVQTLQDEQTGLRLMIKAATIVSHKWTEHPGEIHHLKAYLFQTYRRLVLAALERENGHRQREDERAAARALRSEDPPENLDRKILLAQIMRRMDAWTRQVFEWLVLGHTFEEIGQALGKSGHATRTAFGKKIKALAQQLAAETKLED